MKIFLDSANLIDIEECLIRHVVKGITTNPSILAREPKTKFLGHIKKIADVCLSFGGGYPLSVEVFAREAKDMLNQALKIYDEIGYSDLNIKIPIGWDEIRVVHELEQRGIPVNCTCLFNEAQGIIAANAGARYVSIFFGRLKDIGADPAPVIANLRRMLDQSGSPSQIIVGSIRHERDIIDSLMAGAHIVTAAKAHIQKMTNHPQTVKSVEGFLKDFESWIQ